MSLQSTDIADAAITFCDLQEARHRADYDHLAQFPKASVLGHIQDAEQAIQTLASANQRDREAFFAVLALRTPKLH